jgi:copper resistance protein C
MALLAFLVGVAPAAMAHTELILSTPDDGSHLTAVPDEVVLTFSEDLLPDTVVVSVANSTGFVVRVLDLTVDGADVTLSWPPGMTGTAFDVNYRVVSQDGHPVSGSISFTVDADASSVVAASPAPIPTTSAEASVETEQSSSVAPIVAISVGLAVGIGVGFFYMLTRRRANRPTPKP